MNPLTLVKRIQKINSTEAALGISEDASWHAKYKDSAYIFAGGIPFDLTEGDLLAVFSQYGDVVDVNLVRDKGTGKSRGYAFLAYEDQRSTILAVDNLNGAKLLGRIIRVDHVSNYKKKEEEEDEEKEQQKREARGVCRAFQRGECNRGAACKFSHDEQRSSNTGWGPEDDNSRWGRDKYEGPWKSQKSFSNSASQTLQFSFKQSQPKLPLMNKDGGSSTSKAIKDDGDSQQNWRESNLKDHDRQESTGLSGKEWYKSKIKDADRHSQASERHSGMNKYDADQGDDLGMHGDQKRPRHDGNACPLYHQEDDGRRRHRTHR